YFLFYGHTPKHPDRPDKSCFSQWYYSPFVVEGITCPTAEHFMMAEKARLFQDADTREQIIAAPDPKTAKALGRCVQHFDSELWDANRESIVYAGNVAKFSQNEHLRSFLVSTGSSVLVEASKNDSIWGIGLGIRDESAQQPEHWRGLNLLGFSLMAVRETVL
ncbi:unnamed protein product, partial [Ectocarpus fasciculatus]